MLVLILESLLGLMLGVFYLPVLQDLLRVWWVDPDYSHGFVILLVTAYLIWSLKDGLVRLPR
jgi:Transmembrane exosortase (Exosortase_EpsH)